MAKNPTIYPPVNTEMLIEKIHAINMDVDAKDVIKLRYIADYLGVHEVTLRRKINGELEWKLSEIVKMQHALHLTDAERDFIFFGVG